jgi:hypothetical protein
MALISAVEKLVGVYFSEPSSRSCNCVVGRPSSRRIAVGCSQIRTCLLEAAVVLPLPQATIVATEEKCLII